MCYFLLCFDCISLSRQRARTVRKSLSLEMGESDRKIQITSIMYVCLNFA